MTKRDDKLKAFIFLAGWGDAERTNLAGDASNRRYDRLTHPLLGSGILMDAPPEKGEDTAPFIKIAEHLRSLGLSAPEIKARDTVNGFLIVEDLGDALFARTLERNRAQEETFYLAATDALIAAQTAEPPAGLDTYGPDEMAETACLAIDWYLKYAEPDAADIRAEFRERLHTILSAQFQSDLVLTQRDYHSENLIWIPMREGIERVGLLDFQDAMLGHPAYDLASLLKDARRNVGRVVQASCIDHYVSHQQLDPDMFRASFAACSAQRNLRILGVFARLCVRDGKRLYPNLMPRVWKYLEDDLNHPIFEDFGVWLKAHLPEPSHHEISRIKSAHV